MEGFFVSGFVSVVEQANTCLGDFIEEAFGKAG